jgi:hypothetical protein
MRAFRMIVRAIEGDPTALSEILDIADSKSRKYSREPSYREKLALKLVPEMSQHEPRARLGRQRFAGLK